MRLTDEEIDQLFLIADTHTGGITMSRDRARKMLQELKQRRAADLADEEREALVWLRGEASFTRFEQSAMGASSERTDLAIAALDKLLGQERGR